MDTAAFLLGMRFAAGASVLSSGLAAARTDLQQRRILNRQLRTGAWVLAALYGLCAAVFLLLKAEMAQGPWYPSGFLLDCLIHLSLSAAAALLLWRLRVWPSGDAKLFILLAAGLPLVWERLPGFPVALSWVVLINVFLPAALYVVGEAVWVYWAMRGRHRFAAALAMPGLGGKAGFLADQARRAFVDGARERWRDSSHGLWYLGFILSGLGIERLGAAFPAAHFLRPIAAFASYWGLGLLFEKWRPGPRLAAALFAVAAGALVLRPESAQTAAGVLWRWSWLGVLSWCYFSSVASIEAAKRVPGQAYQSLDTFWVEVDKVKAWTLLSDAEWERIAAADQDFYEVYFASARYPDGLTERQLKLIRAWCHRNAIPRLETQRVIPFAPWIVLGTALTLLLRRDLIGFVGGLLR